MIRLTVASIALMAGMILAIVLVVLCEWTRAMATVNEWPQAAGPGHCQHTAPVTGQCICTRFHLDDQNPQECAYCSHSWSMHSVD